ncbi:MAG: peptide deformylase [Gemmatimonadetes bacterium]|nr:peptide deformylase [Gemmatimonadota bacterium]
MTVRKVTLLGEEVLRQQTEEIKDFGEETQVLVQDLFDTMYHAGGIGIAAPQIGVSLRICVLDLSRADEPESHRLTLINPSILKESKTLEKATEGCLSIPGMEEVVKRPSRVSVKAQDELGKFIEIEADGLLSRVIQHEVDHLDGILFFDRVTPLKRKMLLKRWKKNREEEPVR